MPRPTKSDSATPTLPDEVRTALDADLDALREGASAWRALSPTSRIRLLALTRDAVGAVAAEWAGTASRSKGLAPDHPLRGEEWLSGPYAVLGALDGYLSTLRRLAAGGSPLDGVRLDEAPGGRIRAHVFPEHPIDGLLLSGFTGEIWMRPGISASDVLRDAGLAQLDPAASGGVGLVLGAGNISAIPVLDVLYELLAANRVALLKVNPTQDALVPVFSRALAPLIEQGLVRIVRGGGDVGAYLTAHPGIDHVHITGSAATFDAIVWGGEAQRDTPRLAAPITAELGGVSPIIVVPGRWSEADLRYQAEHIVTMRLHNSGHNCIAGQVVILSADWPQRAAFLRALRTAYRDAPERPVWYPHADERLTSVSAAYPRAQWSAHRTRALVEVGDEADAGAIEDTEFFAPVLGVVTLTGEGQEFVDAAVEHANDRLSGTLGANVLIDPDTESALGEGFERALARLRYGGIAVNAWTGVLFATPVLSWGAFPGSDVRDVGSGIGIVHNTLLLDHVERSVLRGPFRPFPRALGGGRFTVLPTPPWFVTARTGAAVSEGLTRYRIEGSPIGLAVTLAKAMGA